METVGQNSVEINNQTTALGLKSKPQRPFLADLQQLPHLLTYKREDRAMLPAQRALHKNEVAGA